MKDVRLMNIILDLGKKNPEGFDKATFYSVVEKYGLVHSDANSFMLTNMKKAGVVDNPSSGVWVLTEYGKSLNFIDDQLAEKIYRMRKVRLGQKRKVKKKRLEIKVEKSADRKEFKVDTKVNIASLILEIKSVNPKADISGFAAML